MATAICRICGDPLAKHDEAQFIECMKEDGQTVQYSISSALGAGRNANIIRKVSQLSGNKIVMKVGFRGEKSEHEVTDVPRLIFSKLLLKKEAKKKSPPKAKKEEDNDG